MVAYILFDPGLHTAIKDEVQPAVKANEIDVHFLVKNCPRLLAVFNEAMRLTKRDIGIRKVVKPTLLGGKLLMPGNAVILATCQLHDNHKVFGNNIREFDKNRFLERPYLAKSPSFKPFGGGRTYCPGRVFAVQELFSFIALLFHRWNVQLVDCGDKNSTSIKQRSFPKADDSTITLGITRPLPGEDVWVQLSYQKKCTRRARNTD